MTSGYTPCSCRDCFDLAVSPNVELPELCIECEEAECSYVNEDCQREDAYSDH